jgi:hypothetical protein
VRSLRIAEKDLREKQKRRKRDGNGVGKALKTAVSGLAEHRTAAFPPD